jgi:zinc-ribbon domain
MFAEDVAPGFVARGRLRRRVRFLRKARELAYRDLGGLVYNLHRFGQRNDQLVVGKLTTLGHIDTELRTLESALEEREPVTVLREAGLTACPRCAAIHSSEDRFCPNCGLPLSRNVDLPIAGPPSAPGAGAPPAAASSPSAPGGDAAAAAPPPPARAPVPPAPATVPPGRAPLPYGATPSPGRAPMPPAHTTPPPSTPPAPQAPSPRAAPAPPASPPPARAADDQPTEVVRPSSGGS